MARGWESKSVEEQQDAAAERRGNARQPALSAEQIALQQKRAGIELSKVRVLHDLQTTTHPRRRQQLEAALQHLEKQLAALGE